jgi:hypothetical protein
MKLRNEMKNEKWKMRNGKCRAPAVLLLPSAACRLPSATGFPFPLFWILPL